MTIFEFGKLLGIYAADEMKNASFEKLVIDGEEL